MKEVAAFFRHLFDSSGFVPRWKCGNWTDFHGWLYIISDLLIGTAYFTIPIFIVWYIARRKDHLKFHPLYFLFAAFILACGTTHLIDAVIFWEPLYRLSALTRLITGIISWITVFYIVRSAPDLFSLKTSQQLQEEMDLRTTAEKELKRTHDRIVESEKIARLCYAEWDLQQDRIYLSDIAFEFFDLKKGEPVSFNSFLNIVVPEDQAYLTRMAQQIAVTGAFEPFYFRVFSQRHEVRHIRATGRAIFNDMGIPIILRGSLQDVTEQHESLRRIQIQNEKLKEIAWIQSHKVRGPVATIMGLSEVFNYDNPADPENVKVLGSIKEVTASLDEIIREIVKKAEAIDP